MFGVPNTSMLYMIIFIDDLSHYYPFTHQPYPNLSDPKQNTMVNNKCEIPNLLMIEILLMYITYSKCDVYCKTRFCLDEENVVSASLVLTTSTSWEIARPNFTCTVPFSSSTGLTHFW